MGEQLKSAIAECCRCFEIIMPANTLAAFSGLPEEDLYLCHFTLGLFLRNQILHPDSKLYDLFAGDGITDKDDMSSLMLRVWHTMLHDKNYE